MRFKSNDYFLFFFIIISIGCGGGGGGSSSTTTQQPGNNNSEKQWQSIQLNTIESSGLNSPHVKSMIDKLDQLHMVYFSSAINQDFTIYHQTWDTHIFQPIDSKTVVINVDNCRDNSMAFVNDIPAVIYQGGSFPTCGEEKQSDVMMSILEDSQWKEYTIAIGTVERNPVIHNGVAGGSMDMIVDSQFQVHMCFQFFYEGCDSMNVNYPDLWYVNISTNTLDQLPVTETIEGNDYNNDNTQNNAGEHCSIIVDQTDTPMAFYYFESPMPDLDKGIRLAQKIDVNQWQTEWIEKDCEIDFISAAWNHTNNTAGVAYYVIDDYSYGGSDKSLRYAEIVNNEWYTFIVDDSALCGNYCSLAFDNDGNPVIAYRADESHSGNDLNELRVAQRVNNVWTYETISGNNKAGKYNTITIDDSNTIYITSYSDETKGIYVFYQSP